MFGFLILTILVRLVVLFLGIPVHEWAHAWSAYQLGDDTASREGRLTLNPMAHLDPIGSLLILVSGFGWGKPVPVNPYRLRTNPRLGQAITAFAGPLSNFVLAMLLAIPFRMHWADYTAATMDHYMQRLSVGAFLLIAIEINLHLMLFNLIPLFPLDGEKLLVGVLPPRWGDSLLRLRPFGTIILVGLMFILPQMGMNPIGRVIAPAYWFLRDLLVFL